MSAKPATKRTKEEIQLDLIKANKVVIELGNELLGYQYNNDAMPKLTVVYNSLN